MAGHKIYCDLFNQSGSRSCTCVMPKPVLTDRNGLVDPSVFTDKQLRAELARRNIDGIASLADIVCAATDDEILNEGSRRGLTAGIIATHGGTTAKAVLESTTDDQLRAECERRWSPGSIDSKYVALERERDEWKRRCEHTEKALFQMQEAAKALAARVDGPPQFDDGATDEQMRECEAGPGIKALPERRSEPLAFLDEDLLADDAP